MPHSMNDIYLNLLIRYESDFFWLLCERGVRVSQHIEETTSNECTPTNLNTIYMKELQQISMEIES